jgi:DNA-binding ferritin-like protein (Dps family)
VLPPDYRIVYKEMQKYLFKVGPIDLFDGHPLSGIIDFFEEGVAAGKGVVQLIGNDVATFCDDLVKDSRTHADVIQESISGRPGTDLEFDPGGRSRSERPTTDATSTDVTTP